MEVEIPKSIEEVIGPRRLTRYERARIISARALQLSLGAPPLIDLSQLKTLDTLDIAKRELELGLLPVTIARRIPGKKKQLVPIKWLLEAEKKGRQEETAIVSKSR